MRGVLKRYVRGEVAWSQIKVLRILGLDEISLLKGHADFVTIVSAQDEQGHPRRTGRTPRARETDGHGFSENDPGAFEKIL